MSTTRRTAILRARKNSESEQDKRCRKRKKLAVPSSEASEDRNTVNDSECGTLSGCRNNKRSCHESKENMSLGKPTSPVTPLDCSRIACTFNFTDHMKERFQNMTPLPELNWADRDEVWSVLKEKDNEYPKNGLYMDQHPALQPKMRTILLDWLIEVCEVYRLHRETYHLAASYIDRYLKVKKNVQKSRLQLVGVTALFIAAKLEEIYPPKLSEFSYVTDGACTDDEILQEELVMLKTLDWKLTPVTLNTWLRIYLQLSNFSDSSSELLVPDFSGKDYVQVAQLLDLCVLDLESAQFTNRILAAAAIYHTLQIDICLVAGISWDELFACVQWMQPFSAVMKELGPVGIRMFDKILPDDCPAIQTHGNTLVLLNKALSKKSEYNLSLGRLSPPSPALGVLTPPSSTKKGAKIC